MKKMFAARGEYTWTNHYETQPNALFLVAEDGQSDILVLFESTDSIDGDQTAVAKVMDEAGLDFEVDWSRWDEYLTLDKYS